MPEHSFSHRQYIPENTRTHRMIFPPRIPVLIQGLGMTTARFESDGYRCELSSDVVRQLQTGILRAGVEIGNWSGKKGPVRIFIS